MPHYTNWGGTSYSDEGENSEERYSELGENIYLRENSIYTIADGSSWSSAQANAKKLGGDLVTINNLEENIFIFEKFGFNQSTKETINTGYWIGLNDAENEGDWKWISGEDSSWMPHGFQPDGDNTKYEPNGNGDYVWVKSGMVLPNTTYEEYVRQHDIHWQGEGEPLFNERGPDWDDTWESGENTDYGVAEVPFIRRGDSAYVIVEGPTWEEAEANANKLGGHLVTINDAEENEWLINNLEWKPPQDISSGAYASDQQIAYWIGLNDNESEGELQWADGTEIGYLKNETTDAYGDEDWFTLVNNGDWNNLTQTPNDWSAGHWQMAFGIAEIKIPKEIPEPVIRGNSIYTIVDGPSWTEAEANANKLGGHLVTINDQEEQTFIKDYPFPETEMFWIGLTDQEEEGVWKWSSGEEVSYTNWSSMNPSDSGTGEDHVHLKPLVAENWDFRGPMPREWNDGSQDYYQHGGISETKFIRRGDSAYVIVEGPTWEEAEANANKLGGHLVTINDAEENEWLIDTFKDANLSHYPDSTPDQDIYWMGLELNNGTWTWSSGEDLEYTNWGVKEPFGNGDRGQMILESDPRHVNIWSGIAGKWNDQENDVISVGGLGHYGIAEIKIPFVNQDPTGTPLLTGDFIPGEIIDIDLSGVSDPDNYEGFTPEYSYQWEVSTDGENWEIRNQQGATDLDYVPSEILNNTANYFLTPEDEGKQIRAHISYVDGNGTEESVTTDAFDIATRIDLTDENIRRFDPGSVSNINLINFSTLDEKFYRRFDWEEVNYGELNLLAKYDLAWDKVVFRKATRSDDFTIDAVDWDEVNDSKYAKSIYRTVDWDDVEYASMSDQLKEDLDWSRVQIKEAKRSDDFSIDIVDWDEVNESKYAKSIYRTVDWDEVDYGYMSDQLKDDIDWSRVQIKEAKRADDFSIDVMDWDEINASKTAKGIYRNLDSDDFIDIDVNTLLKLEESGLLSRKLKESIRPFINDSIVGGTESEPLLDVSDLDFNDVKLDVNFSSDSDRSLNFGIYIVENLDGAVKDPITGELINPGSIGYEDAALDENNIYFELALNNGVDLTDTFEATDGIDLFAPFMEDELTGEKYFAFDEANSDGDLFFKSNGDGTIGVKDDKNNDDFDDLIVNLDLQSL